MYRPAQRNTPATPGLLAIMLRNAQKKMASVPPKKDTKKKPR
ncbi:hypothetical protein SRS16CHR_02576 [Variovorax sp. SRS16]|nr:hypothetical protein [Variovorax sp. SRS16]VTU20107.1 hypothetical protein SRS16CHR_02576 [Variovorax sp. SRS16]